LRLLLGDTVRPVGVVYLAPIASSGPPWSHVAPITLAPGAPSCRYSLSDRLEPAFTVSMIKVISAEVVI